MENELNTNTTAWQPNCVVFDQDCVDADMMIRICHAQETLEDYEDATLYLECALIANNIIYDLIDGLLTNQ